MLKGAGFAVVALLGLVSCGHHTKVAHYRDGQDGWTISYPASMTRSVIDEQGFHDDLHGVMITSSDRVRRGDWLTFRRFPPDAVAFALVQGMGGGWPDLSPPEARFPLSHGTFSQVLGTPPPTMFAHGFIANGSPWVVAVWLGPKASVRDKDNVWQVVESIRFPPQRTGTMSGDFYVLKDASQYPVGSVVKFAGSSLPDTDTYVPPFFLVHAPGGFYALAWELKFERKCNMGFDRKRFAFFCATRRGWWNRVGEPLVSPVAGLMPDDGLMVGQAKIGRDGQVLVGNWSGLAGPQFKQYEHRFWPDTR